MIACPTIQKAAIRRHYDQATLFYRLFWGRHLHHGLWRENESPIRAQQNLVDELVRLGRIEPGERVLDVGCGMGGSSLFLAKQFHCDVVGVTLSRFQQQWCSITARCCGVHRRARFECLDAELASFEPQSFDVVWSVESTEHFFDKPGYFRRAATWLRPTGRMVVCAWLASASTSTAHRRQLNDVCEGFLCPSLGTVDEYTTWLRDAGLEIIATADWGPQVMETWRICRRRVRHAGVKWLAQWLGPEMVRFLEAFPTILAAYESGAMRYVCFIAKPTGQP